MSKARFLVMIVALIGIFSVLGFILISQFSDSTSGSSESRVNDSPLPSVTTTRPVSNVDNQDTDQRSQTAWQTTLQTGETVTIPNITRTGTQLGSNTYVLHDGSDIQNPSYSITYYESYDFFQITLEREPIREMRLVAERDLRSQLRLSNEQLCELDYSVKTPVQVNQFYAGTELGFSFCGNSEDL